MKTHLQIIPECNAETYFVEYLGYRRPNHQHSAAKVLNRLKNFNGRVAFGLIDNDKDKDKKLLELKNYSIIKQQNNVMFYKHKESEKYIIMQSPAFEKWIFNLAEQNGLLNEKFESLKDIKDITKSKAHRYISKPKFKDYNYLLNAINNLADSPFETIRTFIDEKLNA